MDYIQIVNDISPFGLQMHRNTDELTQFTIIQSGNNMWINNRCCLAFNANSNWEGDILIIKHSLSSEHEFSSVDGEEEAFDICQVIAHTR